MKNAIYHILAFAFLLTAGTACNDDTFTGNAGDGRTVTIRQLTLETGKEDRKDMALTKAKELLSTVNNVTLFIFDESGKMEDYGDLNENSQITATGTTDEGCTIYKLSGGGLEATTGKKTIYAIANHDAPFWQSCLDELKNLQLTEDEFQKKLFTINADLISSQALPGFETDYVLLTGKGTDITVQDDGTAAGTIYVKRPVAQINVRIHTHTDKGGEDRDHTIEFTPSTYTVYNVPQQCMVFNNEGTVPADGTREYYNIRTQNAREAEDDGISYITFYMPENPQPQGNEAIGNDYHKRDKWENLQNGSKHWTYAPQNSTYMVIEGDYIETDQNGMLIYQGKVSYTIHLGDFSAKTGSMRDFSVKRNVRYTYNIKVMGVESIIAEATTDEEKESGAEGNIIGTESAAQIFELDCHYEQVFVSYNLSDIARSLNGNTDDDISQSFMLWASTPFSKSPEILLPYTDDRTEEEATKDMDCKWVSFLPQKEANVLSPYPGLPENDPDTELVTPYRLCKSLGTVVKKILNHEYIPTDNKVEGIWIQKDMNGDYCAYFTVFIDEYYYDKNPISGEPVAWGDFTRQNDRTMIIASDIQSSTDGNSTYSKARTSFTQKAIQTFYNADADEAMNAMGVETYCENHPFSFNSVKDAYSTSFGTSPSNGRQNMFGLLSLNYSPSWSTYINEKTNGYYGTDAAKDSRGHKIENDDMLKQQQYYGYMYSLHPYYACLSRNRDLNGNGKIDDNEVRWYLAAADQYLRMGIGSDAMSDASKLFMEDKSLIPGQTYPDNFFDDGALYYTSTNYDSQRGKNKRLIWAAEIAAFGDYNNGNYEMLIRCVRNLPSGQTARENPGETVTDDRAMGTNSYYYDSSRRLFSFGDILDPLVFREVRYNTPYGEHFEEPNSTLPSTANRLYHGGFVVADKDVSVNAYDDESLATMNSIWDGTENPCARHTDNNDQAHQGAWRVPNLRETLIMSTQPGLFANGNYYYMTSTSFSGRGGTSSYDQRPGFAYDAAGQMITAQPNGGYAIRVRCVRDADPDETYP